MLRVKQTKGAKGSLKWIQKLVNVWPELIDATLKAALRRPAETSIVWQSPMKGDAYAEYSDAAFLNRVGVRPSVKPLADFWPKRGPQPTSSSSTS